MRKSENLHTTYKTSPWVLVTGIGLGTGIGSNVSVSVVTFATGRQIAGILGLMESKQLMDLWILESSACKWQLKWGKAYC